MNVAQSFTPQTFLREDYGFELQIIPCNLASGFLLLKLEDEEEDTVVRGPLIRALAALKFQFDVLSEPGTAFFGVQVSDAARFEA
jgi:hypothetical protein